MIRVRENGRDLETSTGRFYLLYGFLGFDSQLH